MEIIRKEIEELVKEMTIDRKFFHEASKLKYQEIIKEITNAFVDKSEHWNQDIHWANLGQYKKTLDIYYFQEENKDFIKQIVEIVPSKTTLMWFLVEGTHKYWLYEARIEEILLVLENTSLYDFYIISKKYDWLISQNHHDGWSFIGEKLNLIDIKKEER